MTWFCPKGCSQQPCPHSAEAAKASKSDSWLRLEQLEPEEGDE